MSIQSSGKLINNRYLNFKDWCKTFTHYGVNKLDSKGVKYARYRPLDKI